VTTEPICSTKLTASFSRHTNVIDRTRRRRTSIKFLFSSATNFWAILMGAVGAILPDPIQFVFTRWPHEPLKTLQRFHVWAHSKKQVDNVVFGASTQAAFVALILGLTFAVHSGVFNTATAMVRGAG
jgi:hypothetical protein